MTDPARTDDGQGPLRLRGVLRCASMAEVEIARQHLPEHTRLTRAEPGCLSFNVSQTDDPLVFRVEETFADKAAFQFHVQRSQASAWWQATSGIAREFEVVGGE